MSRTILDFPDLQGIKGGEQFPNTITKTYHITVITPLFGGGVETGINDPITLSRPSSVRGHLRFWWRSTRGAKFGTASELRQREGEIWGTSENPSPVTIEVENQPNTETRKPHDYYGFSRYGAESYALFSAQQNGSELCKEGVLFSLTLRWIQQTKLQELRDQENERRRKTDKPPLPAKIQAIDLDIEAAVWAWINFGGIGARTRRGCGALFCSKVQSDTPKFHPPSVDSFSQWLKEKAETFKFPLLAPHDHRAWPTFPTTIYLKRGSEDALASWKEAIESLRVFRQGPHYGRDPGSKRPGRSRWPEAESVRKLVVSQRALGTRPPSPKWHGVDARVPSPFFPRADFGMPIIFEIRGEKVPRPTASPKDPSLKPSLQPNQDTDRMASPVLIRPIFCLDRKSAAMIAILNTTPLESVYLKPGEYDLTAGVPIPASQIRSPTLASYRDSPMGSSGSSKSLRSAAGYALEAFVAFAVDEKGFVKVMS